MKPTQIKSSAVAVASVVAVVMASHTAHSAIMVTQPATITTACATTEMTLANSAPPVEEYADYCIGYTAAPANPTNEATLLNDSTDGSDWTFAYKAEGTPVLGSTLNGIKFTLADINFNDDKGTYTIMWEDTNGSDDYNLPIIVDLAFGMKSGSAQSGAGIAYFLFDDYVLTNDPYQAAGTFDLIVNKNLSHSSLFVRYESKPDIPGNGRIPEPGMLGLLGVGLLGQVWLLRRRRQQEK